MSGRQITPVSPAEAVEEAWFLGLRLNDGVSLADITHEFGESAIHAFQPILQEAQQQGLMEYDQHRARLTAQDDCSPMMYFRDFLVSCLHTRTSQLQSNRKECSHER